MIAVVNLSKAQDADVAFWAAACDAQLRDACPTWNVSYIPVCAFSHADELPAVTTRVMSIVDSLDVDGALGYHTDVAGDVYGRVLFQGADTSITLSHECLEETIDPACDQWRARGDGTEIALEIADPVEGDWYMQPATLGGETRNVKMSNYVTPAWFGGAAGPYDKMGYVSAPWQMTTGGYYVVENANGSETEIYARLASARRKRIVGNPGLSRIQNPYGRILRRLTHV